MARIYISSTYEDLKKEREAAAKAVRRLGHQPICMEDYITGPQRPVEKCLQDVLSCDAYVGIFAWRYGFIPDGYDKSITHLEYEAAKRAGIPCLIFLLDKETPWPRKYIDTGEEQQEIDQLRSELDDEYIVSFFKNADELSGLVSPAVSNLISDSRKPGKDMEEVQMVPQVKRVYENEKGFKETDYGYGIIMVYIPPGKFKMGSNDYGNEQPPHTLYLDGYWIGKYEVTFSQYDRYCDETVKKRPDDRGWGRGERPVINVSWDDANAYCQWLSNKTGLKFKLPTEAQWEKAARGTDNRKYPWGNNEPDEKLANYGHKVWKTSPVGSYLPGVSQYGVMDMAGNVWEWCQDWYDGNYYQSSPDKNPKGPKSGSSRVVRGGSWSYTARYLRCSFRYHFEFSLRYHNLGFRLCQDDK